MKVKPNIERLEGDSVRFADGSVERIDRIVYCTGYKISFPFFDHDLLDPSEDNRIELYRRVVHPDLHGLYFIGLVQPLYAIMPIAERQSEWIADVLEGTVELPGRDDDGARDREGPEGDGQALRDVQAPHDPGRRAALHAPARARAQEAPREGPARTGRRPELQTA